MALAPISARISEGMSAPRPDAAAPETSAAGPALAAADYEAIHAALMASGRGRAFLSEHTRRSRSADTLTVLTAVERLGEMLRGEALPRNAPEFLHLSLMAMAGLIAAVETDMAALAAGAETPTDSAPRVARLSATLRDLGDCVQVMLDSFNQPPDTAEQNAPPAQHVAQQQDHTQEYAQEPDNAREQDDAPPRSTSGLRSAMPSLAWTNGIDSLAPLRALSQAERIALFS
jgi:hypothetical protein